MSNFPDTQHALKLQCFKGLGSMCIQIQLYYRNKTLLTKCLTDKSVYLSLVPDC